MRSPTAILKSLYDKPALVSADYANAVIEALNNKDMSFFMKEDGEEVAELRVKPLFAAPEQSPSNQIGVMVSIEGGLTHKPAPCSGLSSYVQLRRVMEELNADPTISTVVMEMDTPGGMAYQCFETARYIRELFDQSGKKLITYVDGVYGANSAGYALASIADEVIANPDAHVGSIGVVVGIRNTLPKDIKDGVEIKHITFGSKKRPFTAEGNLTKEFIASLEEQVNELGQQFLTHVATFRPLSEDQVQKLEAESFIAAKALELGLVDKVMERDEFLSYLNEVIQETNKETITLSHETLAAQEQLMEQMSEMSKLVSELKSSNDVLTADNKKLASALEAVIAERAEAKLKEEIEAIETSLASFEFIADKAAMASTLHSMTEEQRSSVLSVFEAAGEKVASIDETDVELKEMMGRTSSKVETEVSEEEFDANVLAAQMLAQKYNKGDK